MVSNNGAGRVHYLAGKYPGTIGWLMGPSGFKEPREWLPYALDNGRYGAWENRTEWLEDDFLSLCDRCKLSRFKPRWVAVPDSVGDREATLYLWDQYKPMLRRYGWPLAFVVQDGMAPEDVPDSAEVVFVGGTTSWKWRNAALFAARFPRVHIGRVNYWTQLETCEQMGVESVDGTGFFRGGETSDQANQLEDFIAGKRRNKAQPKLL